MRTREIAAVVDDLVAWIARAAEKAQKLAVSVSGGTDSALALWLVARALPEKAMGVHFGHTLRARVWFEGLAPISYIELPRIEMDREVLRWALFLDFAQGNRAWPVGSRNRTEDVCGLFSIASSAATFLPIVSLWKSEVIEICRFIGVPAEVIESSSLPDPDCGRPADLAALPFHKLDTYLRTVTGDADAVALDELDPAELAYVQRLVSTHSYRRSLPTRAPVIAVT